MKCPSCDSEDVRRSRRRGLREGTALRLKNLAPYRCRECGLRFTAAKEQSETGVVARRVSIADYLGLRGWPRQVFTDQLILGGLLAMLLLVVVIAFFALALGWFEPVFLLPERPAGSAY